MREWAEATGHAPVEELAPPRPFTRRAPRTVERDLSDVYTSRMSGTQHSRYLVPIRGARIVGRAGLVVLPDGRYSSESAASPRVLEDQRDYFRPKKRPRAKMPGSYYSMLCIWSVDGNYYHWLHDTLMRAFAIDAHVPPGTRFIVPAGMNAWQLATLDAIGVTEDRRITFSGEEEWELETLCFAPSTTNSGSDRPDAAAWLRDRICGAYNIAPATGTRRIHVSRREARIRHLTNEDAVEGVLHELGFETHIAESLSHRDQVALFSEAEAIVGAHGAGLTNIMFAPPRTRILDIIEPSMLHQGYVFWSLADVLDQDYWYLLGDSVTPEGSATDAYVPIDKLAATLRQMELDRS